MTKLVAKSATDMTAWNGQYSDAGSASVGEHDSSHYIASSSEHTYSVTGENITYQDFGGGFVVPNGGTLHTLTVTDSLGTDFEITQANVDVGTATNYAVSDDWTGFEQYVFSGKDSFVGSKQDDHLLAFAGNDSLNGRDGNDILYGDSGADKLTGGEGGDRFDYRSFSESTGKAHDTITDLDASADQIGLTSAVAAIDNEVTHGTLTAAQFEKDMQHAVGAHHLDANGAVLFTPDAGGDYDGHTFLVVDINGTAGYQKGADMVIDVSGITGTLDTGDFTLLA